MVNPTPDPKRTDVSPTEIPPHPEEPVPATKAAGRTIVNSDDVKARELERHIGKTLDEPLVGLSLSGGGIRSATFGLGIVQALHSLEVFRHVDYVSSVSGGGYLGAWLQAATARGRRQNALSVDGQEPHDVRFLRAYSNYLTPRLGLFSGDTWAAVGTTLRNLILNLSVLSLSLLAPLYLPWIGALMFWRVVPDEPSAVRVLVTAGILLAVTVAVSTLNMARPLKDGTWSKAGCFQASTWQVHALVVTPALIAAGLIGTVAWAWARHGWLAGSTHLWSVVVRGAVAYGALWFLGAVVGYFIGAWRSRKAGSTWNASRRNPETPRGDLLKAAGALWVLVLTAMVAGGIGTFVMGVSSQALIAICGGHDWLKGLLLFPIGVLSLLLCGMIHIGLAGTRLSDETREWWGRVGGTQILLTGLLTVLTVLALAGPHLFSAIAGQARKIQVDPAVATSILGAIWAAITGAGVFAGHSNRTANGGGSGLLERVGRVAPMVFVFGYLLILAALLQTSIPHWFMKSSSDGVSIQSFTLDEVERSLSTMTAAAGAIPWEGATGWCRDSADAQGVISAALTPGARPTTQYELSLLLMFALTSLLSWVVSRRVDLNEFSLHALYRNRLVRCYLGASNEKRTAHPFTGFDPNDDLPLAPADATHLGLGLLSHPPEISAADQTAHIRPYPLFNVALNLVGGKNLAWQQRKAASFILSPEFCGFEYRVDEDNEQERKEEREAGDSVPKGPMFRSAYAPTVDHAGDRTSLTVGLATATSGAAASPNQGYHTSPTLAFLMTIFNVRLGRWLRNPRWREVWTDGQTGLSLREFLSELLGMTTDDRAWVYLSDGGHFENLGVYELVRRRCRFIIASDAGQDGHVTFEDLGNAIEKCRADFGVDIEIDLDTIRMAADERFSRWHCAIGTIRYDRQNPREAAGTLLYIKSSLTGDESADVLRYASLHPAFPHESTADQFFDESQFESYRALGYHIGCTILSATAEKSELAAMSAVELFTALRQHWTLSAPAPQDAVRKYSSALSDIWTTVRSTAELAFLDEQMFPEWTRLLVTGMPLDPIAAASPGARPQVNYWLPKSAEERRAGFYVCNQMLHLMEDVYLEFKLDEQYDHIDNRGWMNLFQHWTWSGMLVATWAITGSTYNPRFQRFCLRRLDLRTGRPYVVSQTTIELPLPADWQGTDAHKRAELMLSLQDYTGLNFWEATLVDRFLMTSASTRPLRLVPVRVMVESPRRSDGNALDFNVGYLIAEIDWDGRLFTLHHMRIQNHLRKMGLARAALGMIENAPPEGWGMTLDVMEPDVPTTPSDGVSTDEALPSPASTLRVQRIVKSLPRSASVRNAPTSA
jgi:hypothetical protein